MGRKPNPLVVEFFKRGVKLSDSSNRYAYTCRRCGEEFPKGRIDSLTSHLLRRCPHVSLADREWVFQQIQQNPDRSSGKQVSVDGLHPTTRQDDLLLQIHHSEAENHQQSALDTLAEVSRRHLDYSARRAPHQLGADTQHATWNEIVVEQNPLTELGAQTEIQSPSSTAEHTDSGEKKGVALPQDAQSEDSSSLPRATALTTSPLVQTASAANHQLELDQRINSAQIDPPVDPQLGEAERPRHFSESGPERCPDRADNWRMLAWQPHTTMTAQHATSDLPLSLDTSQSRHRLLGRSLGNKKRGRFGDTRRKEVSEIRKRGACIRCRMLKKPCSGDTPCTTCRAVESARLWKGKCLRTRLADEFTLWSMNLFHSKARMSISANTEGLDRLPLPGRIEARLFSASNSCLSFAAQVHTESSTGIDAALHLHPEHYAEDSGKLLLLDEGESLTDKLISYVNHAADSFIREEPSMFVRTTLQLAQELVKVEEAEKLAKGAEVQEQQSPRSSYNVQNELLKNVIELWVQTQLLTLDSWHGLQLRYEPSKMPSKELEDLQWLDDGPESTTRLVGESSQCWQLIRSQLLAAVESRASKLGKTIMNEIERRLLQRQQVSRFATFLSAVILLNCVERMCGLYKLFDTSETLEHRRPDDPASDIGHASNQAGYISRSSRNETTREDEAQPESEDPNVWPLDKPPSGLWRQGQHFSDLLAMLLRMRALPPKTFQTRDGTLAAAHDSGIPIHASRQIVTGQIDEQTDIAAAWLNPLRLSVPDLLAKRDGESPAGAVQSWDMRFVSKLLLPEGIQ